MSPAPSTASAGTRRPSSSPAGIAWSLHARNEDRATTAKAALPGAAGIVVGDLRSLAETTALAGSLRAYGRFDAIVHNAGIARLDSSERELTGDGLEAMFQVNVLAPYLLTALLAAAGAAGVRVARRWPPKVPSTSPTCSTTGAPGTGTRCIRPSKLLDLMLAVAVARRWPSTLSNALDPGWVRTGMGGDAAPTSPEDAARAQVRLAAGADPGVLVTGRYFSDRDWRPAHRGLSSTPHCWTRCWPSSPTSPGFSCRRTPRRAEQRSGPNGRSHRLGHRTVPGRRAVLRDRREVARQLGVHRLGLVADAVAQGPDRAEQVRRVAGAARAGQQVCGHRHGHQPSGRVGAAVCLLEHPPDQHRRPAGPVDRQLDLAHQPQHGHRRPAVTAPVGLAQGGGERRRRPVPAGRSGAAPRRDT